MKILISLLLSIAILSGCVGEHPPRKQKDLGPLLQLAGPGSGGSSGGGAPVRKEVCGDGIWKWGDAHADCDPANIINVSAREAISMFRTKMCKAPWGDFDGAQWRDNPPDSKGIFPEERGCGCLNDWVPCAKGPGQARSDCYEPCFSNEMRNHISCSQCDCSSNIPRGSWGPTDPSDVDGDVVWTPVLDPDGNQLMAGAEVRVVPGLFSAAKCPACALPCAGPRRVTITHDVNGNPVELDLPEAINPGCKVLTPTIDVLDCKCQLGGKVVFRFSNTEWRVCKVVEKQDLSPSGVPTRVGMCDIQCWFCPDPSTC